MVGNVTNDITGLLRSWRDGDAEALEQLTPLVYDELHRRARYYMSREACGHVLQPTALISEVYLRLLRAKLEWQDRAHFYAVCAQLMRRLLTDFARASKSAKRAGGLQAELPEDMQAVAATPAIDVVLLDRALSRLEELDRRKSKVVELRFFGGLTIEETAEVLNVSIDTVMRDWGFARAWLFREMAA